MQQNLPADQFAANMYSIYRFQIDYKLYNSPEEKAQLEKELQAYEEFYLQVQDKGMLAELGFTLIQRPGGHPPPPVI